MSDENTESTETNQSKGGIARAKLLPPSRRKEIARQAAKKRWSADKFPQATHEGDMSLGDSLVTAAVLPDGTRLLTQSTFLQALGRSGRPKGGTGGFVVIDDLPFFLQSGELKPFITEELSASTRPIFFRRKESGGAAVGYNALLLPMVCEVYLSYRDFCLAPSEMGGKAPGVPTKYKHIIRACDALMRGLARLGIIALVDKATGFEKERDEYQKRVAQYIAKELQPWVKTFDDDFYYHIYRLKGWDWNRRLVEKKNHPWAVANITNRVIYEKLPDGVLQELNRLNPRDKKGNRRNKQFQHLSPNVGYVHMLKHMGHVQGILEKHPDRGWQFALHEIDTRFPSLRDPFGNPQLDFGAQLPTAINSNLLENNP